MVVLSQAVYMSDYGALPSLNQLDGDSGGPNFVDGSNVIAGVTSFGLNGNCAGTGGVYRVDRQDDLDWLATFTP